MKLYFVANIKDWDSHPCGLVLLAGLAKKVYALKPTWYSSKLHYFLRAKIKYSICCISHGHDP